jgi:uncharacterized protein YmfQ (DUF2313 family)
MPAPHYSDHDYHAALAALAPRGRAWPREPDSVFSKTLRALAPTYTRSGGRAGTLLVDAFPVAPVELLPEWEATLGLPDPCTGPLPTIQQRQEQVAARFAAGGGQSIAFYVKYAASLGYPITITQFTPSYFGTGFGQTFHGEEWSHTWQVNAPTFSLQRFEFGRNALGEPFQYWANTVLQCELQRLAPAHTFLIFSYS